MDQFSEKKYPVNANDYKLFEAVGDGVSASVYRALCIPLNEIVAVKVLDLEKCNNDLDGIRREVKTMSLIYHPNVLQAHCSFTAGHNLWVVMPYMAGGSCLHIMKTAYPEGFEEPVIATLLHETLKALVYLHSEGHIHRDVKAGNILMDSDGAIKLADFGVSACMFDTGDRQRSRNTFVGTPCWMAPEVMQQLNGYDFKADIWSFGITALELAHGHAPFSKYPPLKVFLMTIQNAPPGLDYERDKRFSKAFKEMVSTCLMKDPRKRPTAEKLLKHRFFKHARSGEYLARTVLHGLGLLGERYRVLKEKEAALLVQNKALYEDKEQLSQQEYIRGISAWNFNLEDLKSQAALIQDDDGMSNAENTDAKSKLSNIIDENGVDDLQDLKSSLASFPRESLQALKDCFDFGEDDEGLKNLSDQEKNAGQDLVQLSSLPPHVIADHKKFLSGPLVQDKVFSPKKIVGDESRSSFLPKYLSDRNLSGPLPHRQKRDADNLPSVEGACEAAVVRKGRFKVTPADPCSKEEIVKSTKYEKQINGNLEELGEAGTNDPSQVSHGERELESHVLKLEESVAFVTEELQKVKFRNEQLEGELNAASK